MTFNELFINFRREWGVSHDVIFFNIIFYLSKDVVNKQIFIQHRNKIIDFDYQHYLKLIDDYFIKNKPLAHIIGYTNFLKLKFLIDKKVLAPRQNTEIMVQQFINHHKNDKKRNIIDLCCGCGCIGISIKKAIPSFQVTCIDKYKKPIINTIKNAKLHKTKINVVKSNGIKYLKKCSSLDILISNPPYINPNNFSNFKMVKWEDKNALFAKDDGLFYINEFINWLSVNSFNEAWIEFGYDQYKKINKILKNKNNLVSEIINDNNFMIIRSKKFKNKI